MAKKFNKHLVGSKKSCNFALAFEKDIPQVYEILKKGCEVAREAACQTMDEVRRAMKINYFQDSALIEEQSRRFASK